MIIRCFNKSKNVNKIKLLQKRFGRTTQEKQQDDKYILFGDFVQPICLPSPNKIKTSNPHKRGCKFSGWTGGKSGEHYLVGHAAEIYKTYRCEDTSGDTAKQNCLSVHSLSPPKLSSVKSNKKRNPGYDENTHEHGMPLVCLHSSAQSSYHQQQSSLLETYELMGLYSASDVDNLQNTNDNRSRLKTKKKTGEGHTLEFVNISPYKSWIQVRLSL